MAVGSYVFARNTPGSQEAVAGLVAIAVGLGLCASRVPRIGYAAPRGRDHLRPGESRRLKWRAVAAVAVAAAVLTWPVLAWRAPFPFPVAAAHALAFGLLSTTATRAWVRILRDPARRGCTGHYDNCPNCDALAAVMNLDAFLTGLADELTDTWLTDTDGTQWCIDAGRQLFAERHVTDLGRERERAYVLGTVPQERAIKLIGYTVWDDGPIECPDFESDRVRNALSIDPDGIAGLHERLERATLAGRTVQYGGDVGPD